MKAIRIKLTLSIINFKYNYLPRQDLPRATKQIYKLSFQLEKNINFNENKFSNGTYLYSFHFKLNCLLCVTILLSIAQL